MSDVREKVITFFIAELEAMFPDIPIIRAKQNMAVQYENYIVIDLLGETPLGNMGKWNLKQEHISVIGLVQTTLNIQSFGKGSVERLSILQGRIELPSVVDRFYLANIAVNRTSTVNDITGLLDGTNYQERASIDLTISYDRSMVDNPGWFDRVAITGILTNKGDEVPAKKKLHIDMNIKLDKEMK